MNGVVLCLPIRSGRRKPLRWSSGTAAGPEMASVGHHHRVIRRLAGVDVHILRATQPV